VGQFKISNFWIICKNNLRVPFHLDGDFGTETFRNYYCRTKNSETDFPHLSMRPASPPPIGFRCSQEGSDS
jgi:hypothetical protein